jgi:flagellar hook protein FlgE
VTISSEGQGFMYVSDNQGQDSMFQISGAFFSRRARKQASNQGMLSAGAVAGWLLGRRSYGN